MKNVKVDIKDFNVSFGKNRVLEDINISFREGRITSIIGPSGCGKTTLLRIINRMNDLQENVKQSGSVLIDGLDIYSDKVDIVNLRKKVGMIFQKPNLFPKSIYENLIFGPKLDGKKKGGELMEIAESTSKRAGIWDEIKNRLDDPAASLSVGQQQRVCIARTLALEPEIILMDETASSLDPVSTATVEELIFELRKKYTIILVTHNLQQAARLSDYTAFLFNGKVHEYSKTTNIFTNPELRETEAYVTGRFG